MTKFLGEISSQWGKKLGVGCRQQYNVSWFNTNRRLLTEYFVL